MCMPNYNRLQKLSLALVETNIVVIIDTIVVFFYYNQHCYFPVFHLTIIPHIFQLLEGIWPMSGNRSYRPVPSVHEWPLDVVRCRPQSSA